MLQVFKGEADLSLYQLQIMYHLGDVSSFTYMVNMFPFREGATGGAQVRQHNHDT